MMLNRHELPFMRLICSSLLFFAFSFSHQLNGVCLQMMRCDVTKFNKRFGICKVRWTALRSCHTSVTTIRVPRAPMHASTDDDARFK